MKKLVDFVFLENTTTADSQGEYANISGDSIGIEISGDHTGLELVFEGIIDKNSGTWREIKGFDMSTLEAKSRVTDNGQLIFAINNLTRFRVKVLSIASGSVKVFGTIIQE